MTDQGLVFSLIAAVVVAVGFALGGWTCGVRDGVEHIRTEAVERGHAERVVAPGGSTEFRWIEAAPPGPSYRFSSQVQRPYQGVTDLVLPDDAEPYADGWIVRSVVGCVTAGGEVEVSPGREPGAACWVRLTVDGVVETRGVEEVTRD